MYSHNPFDYQGSEVKLSYGSKYYRNVEAAHYHKFNNHLALSLAGFYEGEKGFFRNTFTGERSDQYDEAGGKLLLKARFNSGWKMDVLANYQYVDQNGFPLHSTASSCDDAWGRNRNSDCDHILITCH